MESSWTNFVLVYDYNPFGWNLALGALLVTVIGTFVPKAQKKLHRLEWWMSTPKRRGKMLSRRRWDHVKSIVTDDLIERVEQRVYSGSMTRDEAIAVMKGY